MFVMWSIATACFRVLKSRILQENIFSFYDFVSKDGKFISGEGMRHILVFEPGSVSPSTCELQQHQSVHMHHGYSHACYLIYELKVPYAHLQRTLMVGGVM